MTEEVKSFATLVAAKVRFGIVILPISTECAKTRDHEFLRLSLENCRFSKRSTYKEHLAFGNKLYRFEGGSLEPRRLKPMGAEKLVALPMVEGVSDLLAR